MKSTTPDTCRLLFRASFVFSVSSFAAEAGKGTDYDGDGRSDLAVVERSSAQWFVRPAAGGAAIVLGSTWGVSNCVYVPGDYDGDGKADQAYYKPDSGDWYIRSIETGATIANVMNWGFAGCIPVPGDYNGDGKHDLAVYDTKSSTWFIRTIASGPPILFGENWGAAGCVPVSGDFNGDGRHDIAVRFQPTGHWFIRSLAGLPVITLGLQRGPANEVPLSADFDGDGKDDLGVYRKNGDWFAYSASSGATLVGGMNWGFDGCAPVPGDYDGDGMDELAVFDTKNGAWFVRTVASGPPILFGENWGTAATTPVGGLGVTAQPSPPPGGPRSVPSDFSGVTWLHTDVSGWTQSGVLSSVDVTSSRITLNYNKANVWPGVDHVGAFVNANPWIFVPKEGGGWYAATWEWMRFGQTTKNRSSVAGDHIKKSPLWDFLPVPGEWYGFMVSGLARDSKRNVRERTNVVMVQWPGN